MWMLLCCGCCVYDVVLRVLCICCCVEGVYRGCCVEGVVWSVWCTGY